MNAATFSLEVIGSRSLSRIRRVSSEMTYKRLNCKESSSEFLPVFDRTCGFFFNLKFYYPPTRSSSISSCESVSPNSIDAHVGLHIRIPCVRGHLDPPFSYSTKKIRWHSSRSSASKHASNRRVRAAIRYY